MYAAKHETMARVSSLLRPSIASQSDDAREHRKAGLEDMSKGERKLLLEASDRYGYY